MEMPVSVVTGRVDGVRQILKVGLTDLADYYCIVLPPVKRQVRDIRPADHTDQKWGLWQGPVPFLFLAGSS